MTIIIGLMAMGLFFFDLRSYLWDYQDARKEFSRRGAILYAVNAQPYTEHALLGVWLAVAIGSFIMSAQPQVSPSFW